MLSHNGHTARAYGRSTTHRDAATAAESVRIDGTPVVGAVGFGPDDPVALWTPTSLTVDDAAVDAASPPQRTITLDAQIPSPLAHRQRVADVIDRIRSGDLDKVVLARAVDLSAAKPLAPQDVIANFAYGNPARNAFGVDLSAASDGRHEGQWLIGSTPELLVRRHGRTVSCQPFAGSAPRAANPTADAAAGRTLLSSAKNLAEHAFVVDYIRATLAPLCTDLDAPASPKLLSTNEVWHLATPIVGTLADPSTTALDLALALTPTPAVGGTPKAQAVSVIADVEGPRGFYGGTVGWCDADGNGEWMVAIRCLQLAADHLSMRAWAGGGIVAESDPDEELDETRAKFATVLKAIGAASTLNP